MPAGRLRTTSLRQCIRSPFAHPSSSFQKWRPSQRLSPVVERKAFYSSVGPPMIQPQYQERRPDLDDGGDEEASLPQRELSFTESLHRRLRQPQRSKGYEGNNYTPKDKQKTFSPRPLEGSNGHAAKSNSAKARTDWTTKTTKDLEDYLQHLAHRSPSVRRVHNILRELIVRRSIKPTVLHYEALILSHCDAEHGSTKAIKAVLQEMEREHVAIGSSIYEAVLQVLAVHPDYLFRSSILRSMANQWISLTPRMEHAVIAGYIREGQLELALQSIEKMQQQKAPVGQWLYGLLVYSLCEAEDFDAILRLLYSAEDERIDIPPYTLHHLLDRASECLHLDLTKRIWHDMVEPTYINPATGICDNVLLTAARSGDKALAESVSKVLSHRQRNLSSLEYDLLAETYIKAGDEEGAEKIRLRRKGRGEKKRERARERGR